MKNIKYIPLFIVLLGLMTIVNSCQEETFSKDDFSWKEEAMTIAMPGEFENFFYATNAEAFIVNEIDINISVIPGGSTDDQAIDKLEVYAYFIEKSGNEEIMHGGEQGKLFATLTDVANGASVPLTVSVDEVYNLFSSDLTNSDRPHKLLETDLIEFKWVITEASGNVIDTRTGCIGGQCQYIIGVDAGFACPNNLAGVLNYEVLEKGSGATGFVGKTGTVTITRLSLSGDYEVDDAEFGGSWNGAAVPGAVKDDCTGLITVTNGHDNVWEFISFDGPNCTLKWTNKWSENYGEWAVVRLTRQDGMDWPNDLRGPNQ